MKVPVNIKLSPIGLDADGEIEPEQLEKKLLHWRNNVIVHLVDRAAAEIGQELGTDAEDLFRGLMDMDPRKRLTVGAANNHRFVQTAREKEALIHSVGIQHHVSEQGDLDGYLEPVSHLVSTEGYLEPISNEHLSFEETLSVSSESHSENPVEMLPVGSESDSSSIGSSRLSLLVSDEGYETQSVDSSDSDSVFSLDSGVLNYSQGQEVVGAAGHADTFIMVGDGYIGKLTSKNEVDVYRRRKELNLDSIIPQAKHPDDLSASHRAKLAPLEARSTQSDQMGVIVPEMLGADIPVSQKIEMDIKIGFRTASKAQLKKDDHRCRSSDLT